MNRVAWILVCVGGVAVVIAVIVLGGVGRNDDRLRAAVDGISEIRGDLKDLATRITILENRMERVGVARVDRREGPNAPVQPQGDPSRGVAAAEGPDPALRPPDDTPRKADLESLLAEIFASDTPFERESEIWKELREAGLAEKALARIRERAEANPSDPDLQVELGSAYIQQLLSLPDGPERGTLAMNADLAFDTALALDEHHWEARFMKATSLSFWPPIFGKQEEAIHQFERLRIQQEESGEIRDEYAQTYLFLGNLHLQRGDRDAAVEAWRQGLLLFPESDEIRAQLESAGDGR